jgi:segregation and condensation protein A
MPEQIAEPEIAVEPPIAAESALTTEQTPETDPASEPSDQPVAEVPVELPWIATEPAEEEPEAERLSESAESAIAKTAPRGAPVPEPLPEPVAEQAGASPEEPVSIKIQEPIKPQEPARATSELQPSTEAADEKAAAKLAARQKKLDDASEDSPFSVLVDHVYDGPLDLLLDLIRKQDIDIYDIPIAKITAQFLAYVNQLKASDVDVAGEFIYTASLLIHIKSKMLLPRSPLGPDDAAEDPRRELVDRLLEHERFKNAAQMLQQKQMLEAATWTNPGLREFDGDDAAEPEIAADTVDLVRIFRDILERARNRPILDVEEDSVTVGQMIQFLARRLTMEDKPIALRRLLSHTRSERALVAMFLALLELVRLQAVLLRQDRTFSDIFIKKHVGFDQVMNQGLTNALDDWR